MPGTVGVIGLGNMGQGMARNLLRAGFPVVGFDVRPEPLTALTEAGGQGATSLADLGGRSDVVIVMVLSFAQMESVLFGPDGVATTLKPGAVVIGSSTIAPAHARAIGERVAAGGFVYLDAPVSGGQVGADAGTLTIMVGGDEAAFEAQRPIFEAMAANLYYCGPVGTGQTAKMCNQLLAGVNLAASAECIALAAAAGLDRRLLYEIVTHSAGDNWMFRVRGAKMFDGTYQTGSQLDLFIKDLGIVLETADQVHLPALIATAARQWFTMAAAAGYSGQDDAYIIRLMEQFTGVPAHSGE